MVSKQHGTLHYNASEITAMGSGMGPSSGVVPVGGIIMWSGLLASIPAGWHLCDGDAGTPDLRSKFVKGAAAGQNPGATGGGSTYSHSGCSVAAHSDLSHSGGAVSRGTAGVTLDQHAALSHSGGAVVRGTSGVTVSDHGNHTHAYGTLAVAQHAATATAQASAGATARGSTASTLTLGNHTHNTPVLSHTVSGSTNNENATQTHTVNEPNAGNGHDHGFTQPSQHDAWSHTVTEPNAGAGHDHGFTQPSDHSISAHSVTQASDHTGVEPSFFALAFIMRTS